VNLAFWCFLQPLGTKLTICFADSILFLVFAMIFVAGVLYLPEHVSFAWQRAVYYVYGFKKQ